MTLKISRDEGMTWPAEQHLLYDQRPCYGYSCLTRIDNEHLGVLFEWLKREALFDYMLIIVTADHGELLGEHDDKGHGSSLYEEELRIPLVVKYPISGLNTDASSKVMAFTDVTSSASDCTMICVPHLPQK